MFNFVLTLCLSISKDYCNQNNSEKLHACQFKQSRVDYLLKDVFSSSFSLFSRPDTIRYDTITGLDSSNTSENNAANTRSNGLVGQ